jgi:hypothetical protein
MLHNESSSSAQEKEASRAAALAKPFSASVMRMNTFEDAAKVL